MSLVNYIPLATYTAGKEYLRSIDIGLRVGYTVYETMEGLDVITIYPNAFTSGRLRSVITHSIADGVFEHNDPPPAEDTN
jgi:hypothetical protein